MSLEFRFKDLIEIELEIYNSRQRLQGWLFDELELYQNEKHVKDQVHKAYKKLSINK